MSFRTICFRYAQQLRRFPFGWWACTLTVAIIAGVLVTQGISKANAAAARYGDISTIYVARHAIAAGTAVMAADVEAQERPRTFTPSGAITAAPDGVVADVSLSNGDVLTAANTGPSGLSATAALLRPNEQGIAIGLDEKSPELVVGDNVTLLATFNSADPTIDTPTVTVASKARVIHLSDHAATVAVPIEAAPKVAFALAKGTITIAITTP